MFLVAKFVVICYTTFFLNANIDYGIQKWNAAKANI